ncbi:MAG: SPOR domain-containing protein [Massilibacteroides sp.]|nr:SPOR domain-containing protein [Massilibacteroides sp.]MDD3062071.1 SPOR domain-containing protein [Massilibacteroides sp.]MDD4114105.1 SPOR domain-containing protein [Massilibacteroides sp.]MDD4659615.1 SPOR domain-containing protein [Massilibacteroides sp.]
MKKNLKAFFFFFAAFFCFPLFAQEQAGVQSFSIIDALEESVPGKGEVEIRQSIAIRNLIGMRGLPSEDMQYLEISGFRAQVFSGNLRNSKEEAFKREKEIKEAFPELATYVTYVAPFWRLRIGDYRSHEEAYHIMRSLMGAFPAYAKEMYIVKEDVKVPLY